MRKRIKPISLILLVFLILLIFFEIQLVKKQQKINKIEAGSFIFTGKKKDYADWIKNNLGAFNLNDDDGRVSPLVNNAYLWLVLKDTQAKENYRQGLFTLRLENYSFPDNGQRQIADLMESFLAMRNEDVFLAEEERVLENWFLDRVNLLKGERSAEYQGVGAGMAAVAGYLLSTSQTGNFDSEVNDLWAYARTGRSLDTGWSPLENSAHYANYLAMSALRIAIYADSGQIIDSQKGKENLVKLVSWLIQITPHNGNLPAFGATYERDDLRPFFNILYAGSYYLRDYDSQLAGNCKWLAEKIFDYSLTHNQETTWTNHPAGRYEANPIWIWNYASDSQTPLKPDLNRFESGPLYRDFTDTDAGWDRAVLTNRLDKIILRDGMDDNSLYLQLEAAPKSNKNKPYANSITQIVYGQEAFLTDHTAEGNDWLDSWWPEGNVVLNPGPDVNLNLVNFDQNNQVVTSVTEKNGWKRTIKLYFGQDRRIEVFDQPPNPTDLYWHFQGTLIWQSDKKGVTIEKNGYQLKVDWSTPANYKLIDTAADAENRCCGWGWGYVGKEDHQIILKNQDYFITIFRPLGNRPSLTPTPTLKATPTPTSKPILTPTPTPTINTGLIKLILKIKLFGINQSKPNQLINLIVGRGNANIKTLTNVNLTADDNNFYQTAEISLPTNITPGANYYFLIKGPKHLQNRWGNLTFVNGLNTFDLTSRPLLGGDLPVQDGIVNSLDAVKLIGCMSNPNSVACLNEADLNLDGIINSVDMGILNYTLANNRWEDEN